MIVKTKFKKLDEKGMRPFTVQKDITLEILTEDKASEGIMKTFMTGGTFMGEPVRVQMQKRMQNGNYVRFGEGNGFMVRSEDNKGFWLVPIKLTAPAKELSNADGSIDIAKPTIVDEIKADIKGFNDNPEKKVFGFTYKQIAIVAVLVLIARKL